MEKKQVYDFLIKSVIRKILEDAQKMISRVDSDAFYKDRDNDGESLWWRELGDNELTQDSFLEELGCQFDDEPEGDFWEKRWDPPKGSKIAAIENGLYHLLILPDGRMYFLEMDHKSIRVIDDIPINYLEQLIDETIEFIQS